MFILPYFICTLSKIPMSIFQQFTNFLAFLLNLCVFESFWVLFLNVNNMLVLPLQIGKLCHFCIFPLFLSRLFIQFTIYFPLFFLLILGGNLALLSPSLQRVEEVAPKKDSNGGLRFFPFPSYFFATAAGKGTPPRCIPDVSERVFR